jgi:hypothetical protein
MCQEASKVPGGDSARGGVSEGSIHPTHLASIAGRAANWDGRPARPVLIRGGRPRPRRQGRLRQGRHGLEREAARPPDSAVQVEGQSWHRDRADDHRVEQDA